MKIECPKCGHISNQSEEELVKLNHMLTCPQCMSILKIVDGIAYIPNDKAKLDELIPSSDMPPQFKGEIYYETHQHQTEGLDPLYDAAVQYLRSCNAISLPMLQQYFDITPERAEQLMQQLENNHVVAPFDGLHPRKILIEHNTGLPSRMPRIDKYDPSAQDDANQPKQQTSMRSCVVSFPGCIFYIAIFAFVIYLITQIFK